MWSFFRRRRRRKWMKQPLSDSHRELLSARVPAYRRLADPLRRSLEDRVKVLVAERSFEGCDGLSLTEEMKLSIAGHAAVMLLGTRGYFFDSVHAILVFPDLIERYEDGVVSQVVGEAWDGGNVVLTWPEVLLASDPDDGRNVVIHEFAHHLDGLDGEMGGSIDFPDHRDQERWERVAGQEFDHHVRAVDAGRSTLLDAYGALNPAEFFAVASETFFERPKKMRSHHRELYVLLSKFYGTDPLQW